MQPGQSRENGAQLSTQVIGANSESNENGAVGANAVSQFPPITFYPDGSCDSAELILASLEPEPERIALRITGITGLISRRVINADGPQSPIQSERPEISAVEAHEN